MAFFTMDWQAGTEWSWELTAYPFPGQSPYPLKEGVEVPGRKGPQGEQHPLPGADVQVEPGQVGRRPGTQHPAILRLHLGQIQPPNPVGADPLQTEQGGDGKLQF